MGFNIRSVSSSLIHTDIRGSVSIINSSDLGCIIDLARRAVVSENALIEANKRIKELENELSKIRGSLIELTKKRCTLSLEEFKDIINELIKLRNEKI